MKNHASTPCRPIAHVTVGDVSCRAGIVDTLHRGGWSVVVHPTGLHLIHAISGLILGDQPGSQPALIVADAAARGCSGVSIASGLRDLGSTIPVIVVARTADDPVAVRNAPLTIVAAEDAARAVEFLASPHRACHGNPSTQQQTATA